MDLKYPDDLKYLESHEYVRIEGEIGTVGISAFAVDQLGEIVFVELPEVGEAVEKGEPFGNVESVKAAEDIYSPVTGTVQECNTEIEEAPEKLNEDPYGEGWLMKVRLKNPDELEDDDLMAAADYREKVSGE
ncbi:MAG: glycine cleavage system protein GcvH [Hormoscilla sp. SP5CHS1]|nr:glycine cleavage system protein GcvH [Hormoscilla sp. SP12CHS1]MBC6454146.1 glycine cleavage system protein GcvH [Hormoscilla sp. SP5CHS1]